MKIEKAQTKALLWLLIVLILSVSLRVMLLGAYPPQTFGDTNGYFRAAKAVLNGFDNYDGTRTPVYPVFIALLGSERGIYIGQLILGVFITAAWFVIGYKASGRLSFAVLIGLAHSLNPGQFFFEANLLTETLATFWLMLALLGAYFWLSDDSHQSIWLGLGIGISASVAALTRPQFIFLPFIISFFLALTFNDQKFHFNFKSILSVMLPAVLIIGGWMGWIQSRYNIFSLTVMSGFHMVQHTGYYFEDVPDEYAALRDVYLDYRQDRMETYGTQSNTIWDAIPAMQEAAGMSFYQLSRTLQEISIQLILTHPWQYLLRVIKGWLYFWRAPIYWDSTAFSIPILADLMGIWAIVARGLMLITNMVFIISSILALISRKLRKVWQLAHFQWLLAGTIWGTSILTSLVEHGENQRFLIPIQTAVFFWVLWILYSMLIKNFSKVKMNMSLEEK